MRQRPTLVLNQDANHLRHVTVNLSGPRTRRETFEGRQYLVAPMVMLTEGVHEGSAGPLLYRNEDLAKTPEVWNHKPIVVYHPQINGVGVSACDPDILTNRKIGYVFNTTFKDGKLIAEAWLDIERTAAVDERILNALEAGQMVELSTGLFTDNLDESGTWNGEDYIGVAVNHRPDHLAILPDKKGACSIKDGAGLLRNEASHETIRGMIYSALLARVSGDDVFLEAVYNEFFIYHAGGKLFKLDYSATDTEVTLEGDPVEVVRVIEYRTTGGEFVGNHTSDKESDVDKSKFVKALIANSEWTEDDRSFLMGLTEAQLRKMAPKLNEDGEEEKDEDPKDPEPKPEADDKKDTDKTERPAEPSDDSEAPAQNQAKSVTVQEYINNAPPQVRDMLASGLRAHEAQKKDLVSTITANERNTFTEKQLNEMSLEQLQQLARLAGPVDNGQHSTPSYGALADALAPARKATGAVEEEPLGLPTMNFEAATK